MRLEVNSLILQQIEAYRPLAYSLLFLGMLLEGDVVLLTAAFLTHQGILSFGPVAAIVLAGVLIGDAAWYLLGSYLHLAPRLLQRWVDRGARLVDSRLERRPFLTIFFSKFTYGFNHLVLVRAGMRRIRFAGFLWSDLVAGVLWAAIIGSLGFFLGAAFPLVKRVVRYTEIVLLLGLLAVLFVEHFIARWSRRGGGVSRGED